MFDWLSWDVFILIFFVLIPILTILVNSIKNKRLSITSSYKETRKIRIDSSDLVETVKAAMKESGVFFIKYDQNKQTLRGFTFLSIFSWSEQVEIDIEEIENENFVITFKSKCNFPLQIHDWGRNKYNADKFFSNLYRQ